MKKISLLLAFVLTISVANAWSRKCEEAVVMVATEHLTPAAKKMVKKYLGKSYADDVQYLYKVEAEQAKQLSKKARRAAAEVHFLHLDSDFQPKNVEGKDAFKSIEAALSIIRDCKSHPKAEVTTALRTVINLVCDMHNLSKVRIDGIPHSQRDFKYRVPLRDHGPKKDELGKPAKWSKCWNGFDGGYGFYTSNYWAEDLRIYIGKDYDKYANGTLNDWASDSGKMAAHYLEIYKPNAVVPYMENRWNRSVSYEQMVKATCRLAKLLNESVK